jgi:hypothetical protein
MENKRYQRSCKLQTDVRAYNEELKQNQEAVGIKERVKYKYTPTNKR